MVCLCNPTDCRETKQSPLMAQIIIFSPLVSVSANDETPASSPHSQDSITPQSAFDILQMCVPTYERFHHQSSPDRL
ncbi:hypothetical protein LIA77_08034 [Sarocladium implicatum]|nr:hypothetical protein LIA77_08034 [Sarocladium implicatum]